MALETRPIPVLKGKVAKEFFERLKTCEVSKTREEVQEINRRVRKSIEESQAKEREREKARERAREEAREKENEQK
jgi:regulator of replication initiation timing